MTFKPRLPTLRDLFLCVFSSAARQRNQPLRSTTAALGVALAVSMPTALWAQSTSAKGKAVSAAEVAYLVLLGELQLGAQETGIGYSLLLEAARKSGDPRIYQRAMNAALESRAVEAAVEAARAWSAAMPTDLEPQRALLQLLLANNKVEQSASHLEKLLSAVTDTERNTLIEQVGQLYARVADRTTARRVATQALQPWTQRADTAGSAWAAQGMLALSAGLTEQALTLLQKAVASPANGGAPGTLAVELLNAKVPDAGPLLHTYLSQATGVPANVRIAYMRHLMDANRPDEAQKQLETAVTQNPDAADPWLLLGTLNLQNNRPDAAEPQLLRFLELVSKRHPESTHRGLSQAYFSLAQIAGDRNQFDTAAAWLDRIEAPEEGTRVQLRRAALLGRQGKWAEAQSLIRQTPIQQPADARAKLLAEVQLLKDSGQLVEALAVLAAATDLTQDDPELAYEHAMLADKVGRPEEMERILRALMVRKPDYHHAYNALGYALADRNTRLNEAKALILKALEMAPGDPFITDSLGWVEYRLGNLPKAIQLLGQAFEKRPDIEIAVHLAEVLWVQGNRDAALAMFTRAKELQPNSPLLKETLLRLGVPF
jgi:tetratricopeptide (TPR) repeat protein